MDSIDYNMHAKQAQRSVVETGPVDKKLHPRPLKHDYCWTVNCELGNQGLAMMQLIQIFMGSKIIAADSLCSVYKIYWAHIMAHVQPAYGHGRSNTAVILASFVLLSRKEPNGMFIS